MEKIHLALSLSAAGISAIHLMHNSDPAEPQSRQFTGKTISNIVFKKIIYDILKEYFITK